MHKDVHSLQGNGERSYLARAKSCHLEASEPLGPLSHLLVSLASLNQSKNDPFGSSGIWFGFGFTLHISKRITDVFNELKTAS